jgi:thiol-disulfide isomerase/thioredoxin
VRQYVNKKSGLRCFSAAVFSVLLVMSCTSTGKKEIDLSSFRLKTLNGEDIDMSQYEGKRVFINVWATWCKPCVQEMPTIARAMEELKDSGVVFLFASPEETEEIAGFRDRRGFPFEYVRLLNLEALSINALPTTFIFDADGRMVYGEEGFRDWSTPENLDRIKSTAE